MQSSGRSKKIIRRILIVILAYIGISFLSVFLFYAVFFHRTARCSESQETVYETLSAMTPGGTVEPVSFVSGGNTLRGWFLHPETADGVLIMAMGREALIGDHLKEMEAFTADGWNVLVYYGTGCGASDGSSMIGLAQGKQDLSAALSKLSSMNRYREEGLVIYGHSMGAYAAAAVTDEFPDVDGVVCVAGFDTSPSVMLANARSKAGPIVWFGAPFIYLFEHVLFGRDAGDSAAESLSVSGTPAYLLQFNGDPAVPADADIITAMENKKAPAAVSIRLGAPYSDQHSSAVLADSAVFDSVLAYLSVLR